MRVKVLTLGYGNEDQDVELYLVVPMHVTSEEVLRSVHTGEEYDCLCECYAPQDAETIASLWNEKFGAH